MRLRQVATSLSLLCASGVAATQQHNGSGISGGAIGGVSADYVRLSWGPPDSVRLAAAVLWRGKSDWAVTQGPIEAKRSREAMDSARRDANVRGVEAGGTITGAANAWVEYDRRGRTVSVLNQPYSLPAGDSTLVLLVDHVDHVGAEPSVVPVVLACAADFDVMYSSPPSDGRDVIKTMQDWEGHWRTCLLGSSAVREFVESRSRDYRVGGRRHLTLDQGILTR